MFIESNASGTVPITMKFRVERIYARAAALGKAKIKVVVVAIGSSILSLANKSKDRDGSHYVCMWLLAG